MDKPDISGWTEYRPIPGFPGYFAGDDGTIWSSLYPVWAKGQQGRIFVAGGSWRQMKQIILKRPKAYRVVNLRNVDRKKKQRHVHTLILRTFRGLPPAGHQGRHLNDNESHNHLANLAWETPKENGEDIVRNGKSHPGELNAEAKLTDEAVLQIREMRKATGLSYNSIASRFGVSKAMILNIVKHRNWKHI